MWNAVFSRINKARLVRGTTVWCGRYSLFFGAEDASITRSYNASRYGWRTALLESLLYIFIKRKNSPQSAHIAGGHDCERILSGERHWNFAERIPSSIRALGLCL